MNKGYLLAMAAALVAVPAALAHDPVGTPRNYCEDPSEWGTHDYAPLVSGPGVFLLHDGNLAGDCNGDTIPADYDGHSEWAIGGAWFSVTSGDGVTSGSIVCVGEVAHHNEFGPFSVNDMVFGNLMAFSVAVDIVSLVPPTDPAAPTCGDFETDAGSSCVGSCTVTFPAGLDGTYVIFVGGVGFASPTGDITDAEVFLSAVSFSGGDNGGKGKACCSVNCLLGNCPGCCGKTASCYCDMGQPVCACTGGGGGHARS